MLQVEDWAEIRRLHRSEQMPIKVIARTMGISKNTVKAALLRHEPPRYERVSTGSIVDEVEPRVRELLRAWPTMPATVIAERIGWERSIRVLQARVAELRPVYLPPDPAGRTTYLPGEIAQCDLWFPDIELPVGFGQVRTAMQLPVLVMVTGYSRWLSATLIPTRQSPDLFAGWWQLIETLDAVPRVLVWDGEAAVVTMIVSAGRSGVEVPDVVGLRTAAAVTKLRAAGFRVKATDVFSPKPSGTVVEQKPAAADRAEKGSEVLLQVSKGQKRAQVPDVVGQPSADAQAALKQAGFTYTIVVVPSDEARGTVVSQDPQGGTTAPQGSKVRLNVASGAGGGGAGTGTGTGTTTTTTQTTTTPANVNVPKVVGLNQTAAQHRLQAAGLTSNVVYVSSRQPAGRVVTQRPVPGTTVKRGSRVRLNVSTGPNPQASTPVPDVLGQDEAAATSTLQGAGFEVVVIDQPTTDQTEDGIVLDEQPAGGTRAPRGSVVTIYVGRFSG